MHEMTANADSRRIKMLNSFVMDFTMIELLQAIQNAVDAKSGSIIAHHNLHSLYLHHCRPRFREFYTRMVSCAPIDGMPLIWIARLYGQKISRDRRLTYVDFLPNLLELAHLRRWRIYYLGSRPDVCVRGFQVLSAGYPDVELQAEHGFFDVTTGGVENQRVLQNIRSFQPDILMVGMGMPRQEEWIAANRNSLPASVILPCGAAIDYMAGAIPTPPRWAGRIGLEWLFRLCAEPRRLSHRYLVEPWFLLSLLVADLTRRS